LGKYESHGRAGCGKLFDKPEDLGKGSRGMASSSQVRPLGAPRYLAGDVIASKYRLESILGEGGMGTVWHAFNLHLEASVALKLIRAELDRELLTNRLKQEARAAAKLGHPGIVRVFDVGDTEYGDPFIVMELLHGRSLAKLLVEAQRLPAVRAVQLLLPVADALAVAHGKGIVHRDLKPDNVFLAVEDEQLQPKLVDFGIVKLAGASSDDQHLTQAGTVLGSPEYMSPEQARGREDLDHRTDIWSFCVVLYEAVAGVTPFAGTNYNALLRSIVEDEPRSLQSYLASDESLWEIVRRGLAKDRDQRFRSMNELGRALAAWLLRQGIWEDACGGSLETKWINRTSDSSSPRASRSSFASLSGVPPESGVRGARSDRFASTPTIGADSPNNQPTIPAPEPQPARSGRRVVLAAALALALIAPLIAFGVSRKADNAPSSPRVSEPAVTNPSLPRPADVAADTRASPASLVAPAPTTAGPEGAAASSPEPAAAAPTHAAPHPAPKRGASAPSARPPADSHKNQPSAGSGDLLAPY
jgi:serine/threonine protein kinase